MWWTPECGGSQAKESILHHLIYDAYLVLYPVRLSAGVYHRTSRKMVLGHPMVLPSRKLTCNLKLLQACLVCIKLWFAGDITYVSVRKEIWLFSCVHWLPSAIMRVLDEEGSLTHSRQTPFVARFGHFALATESTESNFLPNTSKCLNFLSFGILVTVDSSHAASASTESELEHMQKY